MKELHNKTDNSKIKHKDNHCHTKPDGRHNSVSLHHDKNAHLVNTTIVVIVDAVNAADKSTFLKNEKQVLF